MLARAKGDVVAEGGMESWVGSASFEGEKMGHRSRPLERVSGPLNRGQMAQKTRKGVWGQKLNTWAGGKKKPQQWGKVLTRRAPSLGAIVKGITDWKCCTGPMVTKTHARCKNGSGLWHWGE